MAPLFDSSRRRVAMLIIVLVFPLSEGLGLCAADLVNVPSFGLRITRGFRVSLFADADLANDIYAMTLDDRGNVIVTSQGYIRTLLDINGDGRADRAEEFGATQTGGM